MSSGLNMDGMGVRKSYEVRKGGHFYTEVLSDPYLKSFPRQCQWLSLLGVGGKLSVNTMKIGLSWEHAFPRQFLSIEPWTMI